MGSNGKHISLRSSCTERKHYHFRLIADDRDRKVYTNREGKIREEIPFKNGTESKFRFS
ncbi:hypothetical protein CCACVL1_03285 [Corchorus capsularis]|uniref:Uncharacterized protein n=1 Tax=Corchorus capsularis TaxID=210143 RepID=A0A1R3K181_COCAP|nr:hypothetical protein CCACVL1_03285 [Corchorus capsularis]